MQSLPACTLRNTPTCVGKTRIAKPSHVIQQKHPHVRGDPGHGMNNSTGTETPPRAWGRHPLRRCIKARARNTPTCVGKTQACRSAEGDARKHPHLRGEDKSLKRTILPVWETPPRAWGRQHSPLELADCSGNTPTCMGKTAERKGLWG